MEFTSKTGHPITAENVTLSHDEIGTIIDSMTSGDGADLFTLQGVAYQWRGFSVYNYDLDENRGTTTFFAWINYDGPWRVRQQPRTGYRVVADQNDYVEAFTHFIHYCVGHVIEAVRAESE